GITNIKDPQGVFLPRRSSEEAATINPLLTGKHIYFFQDGLNGYWQPVEVDIRAPIELSLFPDTGAMRMIAHIRNNSSSVLDYSSGTFPKVGFAGQQILCSLRIEPASQREFVIPAQSDPLPPEKGLLPGTNRVTLTLKEG